MRRTLISWSDWRSRQRFDRALWTPIQTVYNRCASAKLKVLAVFGLPPVPDPSEEGQ